MWEKIKRIIEKEGGKCVIIEGDAVYSVAKIDDLEDETEKVNRDIETLKADEEREIKMVAPEDEASKEVRIEDLPF